MHSLLAKELAQEGIAASRRVSLGSQSWKNIISRKIMYGRKDVTRDEYLKGFASAIMGGKEYERFLGNTPDGKPVRKVEHMRDKDISFINTVTYTLLDRCTRKQLRQFIREKDPALLLAYNGLPKNPSRARLVQFLDRHSPTWKYQRTVEKMKRGARKKRKEKARGAKKA